MNTNLMTFSNGEIITSYKAAAYAEGFCEGEGASTEDKLKAWAFLIATGEAFQLQGWFGRTAANLIENEIISRKGTINWENVG